NRIVTVNNNQLTVGGLGDNGSTFSLTKAGNGILNIAGTSTYSGTTTVSTGTLVLTGKISSNTSVASGATLSFAGTGTDVFGDNNTITIPNNANLDVSNTTETVGSILGPGHITRSATGTGTLTTNENNTNTFSGVIDNGNGVLAFTKVGTGTL